MQRRERDATYPPWLWITVCVWESCPETGLAQAQKQARKKQEDKSESVGCKIGRLTRKKETLMRGDGGRGVEEMRRSSGLNGMGEGRGWDGE